MAGKRIPEFDRSVCISCSICLQNCPVSAIALSEKGEKDDKNLYPTVGDGCIGCMMCKKSCPMNAIKEGIKIV